ncbi:hypothetical protein [Novosphingobium sp. Rr 2-17]|uniref:hypothetical protein n=1 Tax=Novosphingobium sp. Rr 2-17 TaxID=555793 RepID=UPI0002E28D59|nr:hypothetical protein [Novosphingobium sp. Rr 2-17]
MRFGGSLLAFLAETRDRQVDLALLVRVAFAQGLLSTFVSPRFPSQQVIPPASKTL